MGTQVVGAQMRHLRVGAAVVVVACALMVVSALAMEVPGQDVTLDSVDDTFLSETVRARSMSGNSSTLNYTAMERPKVQPLLDQDELPDTGIAGSENKEERLEAAIATSDAKVEQEEVERGKRIEADEDEDEMKDAQEEDAREKAMPEMLQKEDEGIEEEEAEHQRKLKAARDLSAIKEAEAQQVYETAMKKERAQIRKNYEHSFQRRNDPAYLKQIATITTPGVFENNITANATSRGTPYGCGGGVC